MPVKSGLTIEDFEKLPDELAENHELIDGELVDVAGNSGEHNDLRDHSIELLRPYVRMKNLGRVMSEQEFDFDGDAHAPDVSYFSTAKLTLYDRQRRIQPFVPDLAIEIVSRNDRFSALIEKVERYRRCGTAEVWVLNQTPREAFVFAQEGNRILGENDLFESPRIPGFSIRIGQLFDEA